MVCTHVQSCLSARCKLSHSIKFEKSTKLEAETFMSAEMTEADWNYSRHHEQDIASSCSNAVAQIQSCTQHYIPSRTS